MLTVSDKMKEQDGALDLPEDYGKRNDDIIVVGRGDDGAAVDAFYERFGDRLIVSKGRFFWYQDGLYHEGRETVKSWVMQALKSMNICTRGATQLLPYSCNARHLEDCTKLILQDTRFEQDAFLKWLWESNLGYLAFKDGVYCFDSQEFTKYPVEGVYFTHRINRSFPAHADDSVLEELMHRVIDAIFKDREQRDYVMHCLARALAGKIGDNKWHVCVGERNSGKSVIFNLLRLAFESFVQTLSSENLSCRQLRRGAIAKKQKWMRSLEYKRICFSNEIVLCDKSKMDGNMIKRLASGGDEVEVRTNYKNEERRRLQCTLFLCCNDFPSVDPVDAYETLDVFSFGTKFESAAEIDARKQEGDCPAHWAPADPAIKEWIKLPAVVDAFTRYVLQAYAPERLAAPASVAKDTGLFKGPDTKSMTDRFSEIVKYVDDPSLKVFSEQIKMALEESGVRGLSTMKINDYVKKLYGDEEAPPEYKKYSLEGKKAHGFNRIMLLHTEVAFNCWQEIRKKRQMEEECVRQEAKKRFYSETEEGQ